MRWHYCMSTMAWWLMRPISATESERAYGPFTDAEARLAADIHGIDFDAKDHP